LKYQHQYLNLRNIVLAIKLDCGDSRLILGVHFYRSKIEHNVILSLKTTIVCDVSKSYNTLQ